MIRTRKVIFVLALLTNTPPKLRKVGRGGENIEGGKVCSASGMV